MKFEKLVPEKIVERSFFRNVLWDILEITFQVRCGIDLTRSIYYTCSDMHKDCHLLQVVESDLSRIRIIGEFRGKD